MKEKSQYNSLSDWRKACPSDYANARRNNFLDIIKI